VTILAELVEVARRIATALEPPVVERVVVPTADLPDDRHGSFCAVKLADGSTGLAYILLADARARLPSVDVAALAGSDAVRIAEGLAQDDPAIRSIALAALNAMTRHLLDAARFSPDFATNSLGSLALAPGDLLGMIGYFPPLVERAREQGIPLTVVELRPDLVQEMDGLTVTLDPARLSGCTKVVSTSTVLLNDSLESVLWHARHCRELVLIGPSAGCVPDPLFARGVTGIGGAWVTDPDRLLERVARGERWRDATRKFSLRKDRGCPDLEELIRRASG
jgi:uncharacterized protein (DUF4213/DUF364 family)